ncbi:MAG: helix-turn-helix domain-containing protein [Bacteroidales bacterium]|jgi:transcriptional regulator with XRE-family HTH domain|nr:helix-turn-helix domain-containing protein [Bacteroidales bacterium]
MNTDTAPLRKVHHGRNIKRLRDMLGMKQETIAIELDITQQSVSDLEQKEVIDDIMLDKIAKILKVPVAAIKNMNDEATISYINTFNDSSINHGQSPNYYCTFNPLDKVVELYERMLKSEQEKVVLLEKTFDKLTGK